jgi:hypothetical protein
MRNRFFGADSRRIREGGEQTQGLQKEAENRQRGAQSSQLISPQDNSDQMYEGIF